MRARRTFLTSLALLLGLLGLPRPLCAACCEKPAAANHGTALASHGHEAGQHACADGDARAARSSYACADCPVVPAMLPTGPQPSASPLVTPIPPFRIEPISTGLRSAASLDPLASGAPPPDLLLLESTLLL